MFKSVFCCFIKFISVSKYAVISISSISMIKVLNMRHKLTRKICKKCLITVALRFSSFPWLNDAAFFLFMIKIWFSYPEE